ncbi:MAG: hypothetical protein ABSF38_21560 [Verrucomicrobiota bacterium]|jgi:hypothetical protein
MKTKDILTIVTAALATATLTVAFHASPLVSGNDPALLSPTIAKPKLAANGIEVTLSPANGRVFKAGDQPDFELRSVNTLNQPSELSICVALSALGPVSRLSRTPVMPSVLWQQQLDLTLGPNETKLLTLATRAKLPANSSISVSLSQVGQAGKATAAANPGIVSAGPLRPDGQPGIVALRFSTAPPPASPANADAPTAQAAVIAASR